MQKNPKHVEAAAKYMSNELVTVVDVGKYLGVSSSRAGFILKKLGVHKTWRDRIDQEAVIRMYTQERTSVARIAEILGGTQVDVLHALDDAKIKRDRPISDRQKQEILRQWFIHHTITKIHVEGVGRDSLTDFLEEEAGYIKRVRIDAGRWDPVKVEEARTGYADGSMTLRDVKDHVGVSMSTAQKIVKDIVKRPSKHGKPRKRIDKDLLDDSLQKYSEGIISSQSALARVLGCHVMYAQKLTRGIDSPSKQKCCYLQKRAKDPYVGRIVSDILSKIKGEARCQVQI